MNDNKLEIFTKKVNGKHCVHFKFGNQTFRLSGFDTKEEAEWEKDRLSVLFCNYGLMIWKNAEKKILDDAFKSARSLMESFNKSLDNDS